jgi:CheY-like chemotaxis protein
MEPAKLVETSNNTDPVAGQAQLLRQYLKNAPKKPRTQQQRDLKILLVDDDVESIIPMHLILAGMGCEISIAFNGQSAINYLIKRPFDLVILDWLMPDLNGLDVLKKSQNILSREDEVTKKLKRMKIPFVTYSGCSFKDVEIPNCSNFDFVGHWQKPISLNKLSFLTSEIVSWLNKR